MTKRRHAQTDPAPADRQPPVGGTADEAAPTADGAGGDAAAGNGPAEDAAGGGADGATAAGADAGMEAEADALRRERDEALDKWLRAMAELDNLRKRTRREVADARRFAQADALRGFLDVLDNLERALQSASPAADTGAPDPFRDGIELIRQKFRTVLQDQGVTPIDALGLHLDPLVHEAVGQLPREGAEPGTVIEVAQAGYRLGELVLRPARVIICA